jgi:hypothetical protein
MEKLYTVGTIKTVSQPPTSWGRIYTYIIYLLSTCSRAHYLDAHTRHIIKRNNNNNNNIMSCELGDDFWTTTIDPRRRVCSRPSAVDLPNNHYRGATGAHQSLRTHGNLLFAVSDTHNILPVIFKSLGSSRRPRCSVSIL